MNKQHPKRRDIVSRLVRGESDHGIGRALGVDRHVVATVRKEVGIAVFSQSTPVEEQLRRGCGQPDAAGHVFWEGPGDPTRTARIRFHNSELVVSHLLYQQRTGKPPVGQVRPSCGEKRCIAPGHLTDDIERRKARLLLRAVYGMPKHWDTCGRCGSSWDEEGRVEDSLTLYCRRCTADRARRNRSKGTTS